MHPRYNPERDGRPQHKDCLGCESLHVIHLYTHIARRKAESGEGILVSRPEIPAQTDDPPSITKEAGDADREEQGEPESPDPPAIT